VEGNVPRCLLPGSSRLLLLALRFRLLAGAEFLMTENQLLMIEWQLLMIEAEALLLLLSDMVLWSESQKVVNDDSAQKNSQRAEIFYDKEVKMEWWWAVFDD
jgi:hypothetical protein